MIRGDIMELSIDKSIKLRRDAKLNFCKSGSSVSREVKGIRFRVNNKDNLMKTVSIFGTGVRYTKRCNFNL